MQEDQQKQLKDMKENIGYYHKKAQELEVLIKLSLREDLSLSNTSLLSMEQQHRDSTK